MMAVRPLYGRVHQPAPEFAESSSGASFAARVGVGETRQTFFHLSILLPKVPVVQDSTWIVSQRFPSIACSACRLTACWEIARRADIIAPVGTAPNDPFLDALHSDSPLASVESLLHRDPALPERIGQQWKSGFSTAHIPPEVARLLVAHGAPLSIHAAAAFGFTDKLTDLLRADLPLISARGVMLHATSTSPATSPPLSSSSIMAQTSTPVTKITIPLPPSGASAQRPKFRAFFSIAAQPPTSSSPLRSVIAISPRV